MNPTAREAHLKGKSHRHTKQDAESISHENPDATCDPVDGIYDLHSHVEDGLAKYLLTETPYVEWDEKHTHGPEQPDEYHWHNDHRDGQLWDNSDPDPALP